MTNSGSWMSASAHCAAHRCEQAIPLLEDTLRQRPGDADLCQQTGLCYSGACRHHALVSLPLAVAYIERALRIVGPGEAGSRRARYLESLGNTLRIGGDVARAHRLLGESAALLKRHGPRDDWARVEFNLGNICCDLAGAGDAGLWTEAIRHYRNALDVRRETADPLRFAATVQNLGTAYREAKHGAARERLRQAIGCYYAAFRAYAGAHLPQKLAGLHNNLGNAYLELSAHQEDRCRHVRRALAHFARALRRNSKDDRPCEYAVTQYNRAQGYLLFAPCGCGHCAAAAAQCLRESLDGFERCGDTARAAMVARRLAALVPSRKA
ncbi:MAG: tetratricopeptide repeat protein [Bryobacteraceae bacterium]|nr:tetratricopeptide repeat protein [Solibacteraceae bacterium]MCO5352766.1 tetratricopeptide repeat protein [Bryobacteraceae bacterium]